MPRNGLRPRAILSVLDVCCDTYKFPMLDNGYVYLAGTRLSLFRSTMDWAIVIEVFGFSCDRGCPTPTFIPLRASFTTVTRRNIRESRGLRELPANNPHNDSRFVFPIDEGSWQHPEDGEFVAEAAHEVVTRGQALPLPAS